MVAIINRFFGPYWFLSNFYPAPFVEDGIRYATNEHFFNAMKTEDLEQRQRIAAAETPDEAKRRGRRCTLRPNWDSAIRYEVMRVGLELKFRDLTLRARLLDTGDAQLIEGNTWHDTHWGVCVCGRHQGQGDNHLGRLLMERREQLRAGRR